MALKIFACTDHEGHWPVGVASVVVAADEASARQLLLDELMTHGLKQEEPFTLRELAQDKPRAFVLMDGDY